MKSEASPLTASLLARKGAATPSPLFAVPTAAPRAQVTPFATKPVERPVEQPVAKPDDLRDRRRLTLRLDPDRHMRLKLATAHLDISLQDFLIAALDAHLAREAPCACLKGE
jgi:hypothetical protein